MTTENPVSGDNHNQADTRRWWPWRKARGGQVPGFVSDPDAIRIRLSDGFAYEPDPPEIRKARGEVSS